MNRIKAMVILWWNDVCPKHLCYKYHLAYYETLFKKCPKCVEEKTSKHYRRINEAIEKLSRKDNEDPTT